jgi:hypothetical protein
MTHVELHNELAESFKALKNDLIKDKKAKELANLAGKMINIDKLALASIALGIPRDVPMLGIKQVDTEQALSAAGKLSVQKQIE